MKSIPLGQYAPLSSPIHNLDSRTKLIGMIILTLLTLLAKNSNQILILSLFLVLVLLLSKFRISQVLGGLKGFTFIFLFTLITHTFFSPNGRVLPGLYKGVFITLQLSLLVLFGMILTWTTPPLRLVDGLRWIFSPFRFIRVPVDEFALIIVIALRFMPVLILEAERLTKAKKSREIELKSDPIRTRIKNSISIILPVFLSVLRRAEELSLVLEARCFKGMEGRSWFKKPHFKRVDLAAWSLLALVFTIWIGFW